MNDKDIMMARFAIVKALEQIVEEVNANYTRKVKTLCDPIPLTKEDIVFLLTHSKESCWMNNLFDCIVKLQAAVNHEQKLTAIGQLAAVAAGMMIDLYRFRPQESKTVKIEKTE